MAHSLPGMLCAHCARWSDTHIQGIMPGSYTQCFPLVEIFESNWGIPLLETISMVGPLTHKSSSFNSPTHSPSLYLPIAAWRRPQLTDWSLFPHHNHPEMFTSNIYVRLRLAISWQWRKHTFSLFSLCVRAGVFMSLPGGSDTEYSRSWVRRGMGQQLRWYPFHCFWLLFLHFGTLYFASPECTFCSNDVGFFNRHPDFDITPLPLSGAYSPDVYNVLDKDSFCLNSTNQESMYLVWEIL